MATKAKPEVVEAFKLDLDRFQLEIKCMGLGYLSKNFRVEDLPPKGGIKIKAAILSPEEAFEAGRHLLDPARDGATDGIPAAGFARAIVDASYRFAPYKSTQVRSSFFILAGDDGLVPILDSEPVLDTRLGRNPNAQGRPAIVIHRPLYPKWRAVLAIEYNQRVIAAKEIIALVELAGFHIGVGEMRPEKVAGGLMGRFETAKVG